MFVKACHRRGIAVILDVCYNHFDPDGERAEWAYDSNDPVRNIYYWYEGKPSDYFDPSGGYIDNISTGWAPRMLSILSVGLIEALKIAAIEDGTKGSHIVEEAVRDWLAKRKTRRSK